MNRLFTRFQVQVKPPPTPIGLRTVLNAFKNVPPPGLTSQDIFKIATKDYPPPDPPLEALKTVHKRKKALRVPVILASPKWRDQAIRSMRHLKTVILQDLDQRQLIQKIAVARPPATPEEENIIQAQQKKFAKRAARRKLNHEPYNKPEANTITEWFWDLTDVGKIRLERGLENWDPSTEDLPVKTKSEKGKKGKKKTHW